MAAKSISTPVKYMRLAATRMYTARRVKLLAQKSVYSRCSIEMRTHVLDAAHISHPNLVA